MGWRISRALLDRLHGVEQIEKSREICGILLANENRILGFKPIPNVAEDPHCAFMLDPAAHLAALRAARASGLKIVGHYHSHPGGDPSPSAADAQQAGEQGQLWLILAGGRHALWRSRKGGPVHRAFEHVELEIS